MARCLEMATVAGHLDKAAVRILRHVSAGRNEMKRFYPSLAVAALMGLGGWAFVAPASAAPPTVTPSPGYDARLQEQRAASTIYEPGLRYRKPVVGHRVRRIHRGAH
jgi:hypothetical protein